MSLLTILSLAEKNIYVLFTENKYYLIDIDIDFKILFTASKWTDVLYYINNSGKIWNYASAEDKIINLDIMAVV